MSRPLPLLGLAFLTAGLTFAQTAGIEAADVHVSPAGGTESFGFLPNGRMEFHSVSLLRLISQAYSVTPDRISGGPSWLDTDQFDILAKAAGSPSGAAMRTLLQGLLVERFDLKVKQEEKPQPVFALVPGKRTPKESAGTGEPDCKLSVEENVRNYACHNVSMASLAERLAQVAAAYFPRPVIDRTGLKGTYDFTLQWKGRGQLPPGAEGGAFTIYATVEKQLGIKIEEQTEPMTVLTVEHANRTPTANAPGVTEKLGPPPTEFEVASIKPSKPGTNENFNMTNGRIDAKGITLKDILTFAWDVEDDWVRGEKWIDTERFDIAAKTAPTASPDTLRTMVRSLLIDRFKMKAHKEPQPVAVYALTAVKPKLKEADPSQRSSCKIVPGDGVRTYVCQNTTMAQFAEKIRNVAQGYLEHPVVDLTGLKGAYDFTVAWAPRNRLNGNRPGAADNVQSQPTAAAPTAEDRPVGLTLSEAVDRQLGLKLGVQKHPMPVLIIDHMERTPTEN